MPEPQPCFDLVDEPWIPVRMVDGQMCDLGLRDTLVRAHEIAGLSAEFVIQEPPLLRLLLAVCYRAFAGPENDDQWDALWDADRLPEPLVVSYLDKHRPRFDLFHPETPFFQTAGLVPSNGKEVNPASRLIAYAPTGNSTPLFTPIYDDMKFVLTPAEAARWLIQRHAWGSSADKTGAEGNDRVKNGKDSPQLGHLGWIGFTAPTGSTLKESLLLNMVPWARANLARGGPDDLPAWERPPTSPMRTTRAPDGMCDLYTWQSRRIRLVPEMRAGLPVVASALVCAGDNVDRATVRSVDPHTGWVSRGETTYAPLRINPGQQVWRGLSALLAAEKGTERAGVLSWVAALEDRDVSSVSLLVATAAYGPQYSVLEDLLFDTLTVPVAVLRRDRPDAYMLASDAVVLAEGAATALGHVARAPYLMWDAEKRRYLVPEGEQKPASKAADGIAEDLFAALDLPFRRFLAGLGDGCDLDGARRDWVTTVKDAAVAIAERHVVRWGQTQAFAGAQGESRFRRSLTKCTNTFCPTTKESE
ncbi:MAG: type I-E CRISPR-associated protein Cse1/CasA [Acidimicrobiales bacterium]